MMGSGVRIPLAAHFADFSANFSSGGLRSQDLSASFGLAVRIVADAPALNIDHNHF
jgi:hypothetical protein